MEQKLPLNNSIDIPSGRDIPLQQRTLPAVLKLRRSLGNKLLVKSPQGTMTYAEAWELASLVAGKFSTEGIRKSDRMIVMLPNCMETLEIFLGAGFLGAIFVPINTAFRGSQLKHLLDLADPVAIITVQGYLSFIEAAGAGLKSLSKIWLVQDNTVSDLHVAGLPVSRWEKGRVMLAEQSVACSDPLAILYTSGTTGPSKGVLCPHAQFYWWGILSAEGLGMHSDDTSYTVLPMFHTNALNNFWQVLLAGATYSFGQRFSASGFMQELRESQATITYMLGSMAHIMLKQPESNLDTQHSVKCALSCPP